MKEFLCCHTGCFLIFIFKIFNNSVNFRPFFILITVMKSQINGQFDGLYGLTTKQKEREKCEFSLHSIFFIFSIRKISGTFILKIYPDRTYK